MPTKSSILEKIAAAEARALAGAKTNQLFWLSFADATGFKGACIVNADDFPMAVAVSKLKGCNPGGEVRGAKIDMKELTSENLAISLRLQNRLLSLEDMYNEGLIPQRWDTQQVVDKKGNPLIEGEA